MKIRTHLLTVIKSSSILLLLSVAACVVPNKTNTPQAVESPTKAADSVPKTVVIPPKSTDTPIEQSNQPQYVSRLRQTAPLTHREFEVARHAWRFFEVNYKEKTGLVNAVDKYPATTMWDTASYMGGLVAAYELGVIDQHTFNIRMVKLLGTLNKLDFFRDELPNKAYNTETGVKSDYKNQPGEVGFTALDLGRMLIWLKIIKERYPSYSNAIDNFVLRWNFTNLIDKGGTLYGAILDDEKKTMYVQEGRLGYEEYSSKGFQLWGFNTDKASKIEPYDTIRMFGIDVPYDSRDPRTYSQHNYVVAENFILDAVELNWDMANDRTSDDVTHTDTVTADFAQRIYKVQELRYQQTGIITARTEHQLDGAPYFIYDTIFCDGYPWNTITDEGKHFPEFSAIALKAAFGMWAVWDTPYTQLLFDTIADIYDPDEGFNEGLYENGKGPIKAYTANNNGIILETLLYKAKGKILRFGQNRPQGLWEKAMQECDADTRAKAQCRPK